MHRERRRRQAGCLGHSHALAHDGVVAAAPKHRHPAPAMPPPCPSGQTAARRDMTASRRIGTRDEERSYGADISQESCCALGLIPHQVSFCLCAHNSSAHTWLGAIAPPMALPAPALRMPLAKFWRRALVAQCAGGRRRDLIVHQSGNIYEICATSAPVGLYGRPPSHVSGTHCMQYTISTKESIAGVRRVRGHLRNFDGVVHELVDESVRLAQLVHQMVGLF